MKKFCLEKECKSKTGLSRTTRWALEKKGLFPKRRQVSPGRVGWLESELDQWIESRSKADGSAA